MCPGVTHVRYTPHQNGPLAKGVVSSTLSALGMVKLLKEMANRLDSEVWQRKSQAAIKKGTVINLNLHTMEGHSEYTSLAPWRQMETPLYLPDKPFKPTGFPHRSRVLPASFPCASHQFSAGFPLVFRRFSGSEPYRDVTLSAYITPNSLLGKKGASN